MSDQAKNKEAVLTPAEHVAQLVKLGVVLEWCDSHIETYYNNYLNGLKPNKDESTKSK